MAHFAQLTSILSLWLNSKEGLVGDVNAVSDDDTGVQKVLNCGPSDRSDVYGKGLCSCFAKAIKVGGICNREKPM